MSVAENPTAVPDSQYDEQSKLGLPQASAIVMGSIIGVGVFSLPYALASYGPISLVAMVLTTIGALALALMYASLSKRINAPGGPYAYTRAVFGNTVGFMNAWSYWITAWAGNAAIATGWVYYVVYFFDGVPNWVQMLIALGGLWIPALINLTGLKNIGAFQLITTILKFVPLILISFVGIYFIDSSNFDEWNHTDGSAVSAVLGAMAILLFSYLGVETATVTAAAVKNPKKNVAKATVLGTIACAIVYILSLITVFGVVPANELGLEENQASYSVAANQIVGGTWAGYAVAIAVIISGIGALNGWVMICAEMPRAAAIDGVFPQRFAAMSAKGVPAFGIITSTVLASIVTIVSYLGASGATIFTTLVFMSGITAAIPYAFSAAAQIVMRVRDNRRFHTPRFVRDVVVAVVALVFSILFIVYSRNTDEDSFLLEYGPYLMIIGAFILGVPVYLYMRDTMTEPEPIPDYSVVDEDPRRPDQFVTPIPAPQEGQP